jgi:predicted transcriptional regulator
MRTLNIRLPDDTHLRLEKIARSHHMSVNRLIEGPSTIAIAQLDAETRFGVLAARGSVEARLRVVEKLDDLSRRRTVGLARPSDVTGSLRARIAHGAPG